MFQNVSKGLLFIGVLISCWAGVAQAKEAAPTCSKNNMDVCDVSFTLTPTFATMCENTLQTGIFTIKNNTPVTMPIQYIRVLNANGSQNAQATIGIAPSNNCGTSLAPGASCNIAVNVVPLTAENFNLVLDVGVSSSQGKLTTPITLSSVAGCNVGFTPPLPVFINKCSTGIETGTFTITNNDLTPLPIGTISFSPQPGNTFGALGFGTPVKQCVTGHTLAVGDLCRIQVVVPAGGAGTTVNQLLIANIDNVPLATPIALSVIACNVAFDLPLPTFSDICSSSTESQTFTITNTTLTALPIGTILIATQGGDTYTGTVTVDPASTCGSSLGAGASCTIQVDVNNPIVSGNSGIVNRQLQVPINGGTLFAPIQLTVDPSPCTFIFTTPLPSPHAMTCGIHQDLTYIVKNNSLSSGAVSLPSLTPLGGDTLPGAATITGGTCPTTLAPEATCTVLVDLFEACPTGGVIDQQLNVPTPTGTLTSIIDVIVSPTNYLGRAGLCAVLGSSTVTNTGSSVITGGDVCLSPGSSVTGFPPGVITPPGIITTGTIASDAHTDLGTAITTLQALPCTVTSPPASAELGGQTLTAVGGGYVYCFTSSADLTGILTLTGGPTDVFVFNIGSTLTTAAGAVGFPAAQVVLSGGVNPDNVYWVVGSSATLGTYTQLQGNILAVASITMTTGSSLVYGRALARDAAVTLDTNAVTVPP